MRIRGRGGGLRQRGGGRVRDRAGAAAAGDGGGDGAGAAGGKGELRSGARGAGRADAQGQARERGGFLSGGQDQHGAGADDVFVGFAHGSGDRGDGAAVAGDHDQGGDGDAGD